MAADADRGAQSQTSGLTVPAVSGNLARGGQFSGTLTIARLTNRAGQLVADGQVAGNVTTESVWATPVAPACQQPAPATFSAHQPQHRHLRRSGPPQHHYWPRPRYQARRPPSQPPRWSHQPRVPRQGPTRPAPSRNNDHSHGRGSAPAHSVDSDAAQQQSTAINQIFREIPLTLTDPDLGACGSLILDLGVVFVDQLRRAARSRTRHHRPVLHAESEQAARRAALHRRQPARPRPEQHPGRHGQRAAAIVNRALTTAVR